MRLSIYSPYVHPSSGYALPTHLRSSSPHFGAEIQTPAPVVASPAMVEVPTLKKSQRAFAENILDKDYLPNPNEANKKKVSLFPSDHPLDWTLLDKSLYQFKQLAVNVPRNLMQGLKGSPDFDFTKQMSLNVVPFSVGSALFVSSYLAGGTSILARNRALAGTTLYALGQFLGQGLVNTAYKARWGFDLSDKYLKANRQDTGPIAVSVDFPRTDLIPPEKYEKYRKRWGIPNTIAHPQDAVEDQMRIIATQERFLMTACASMLSAIGAGYLAQSDHWRVLWGKRPPFAFNLMNASSRALLLGSVRAVAYEKIQQPLALGLTLMKSPKAYPLWQGLSHTAQGQFKAFVAALGMFTAVSGYTLYRILVPPPRPNYQPAKPEVLAQSTSMPSMPKGSSE